MGKDGIIKHGLNGDTCTLFKGLDEDEIDHMIENSALKIVNYEKDSFIFRMSDTPKYMFVLLKGTVTVEKYDLNGKRNIVNSFSEKGTVFGEVYLYLKDREYDYSCRAAEDSEALAVPKDFIINLQNDEFEYYRKIVSNMLEILSEKAYFLNQKLQIHSSFTLRQKIANFLIQNSDDHGVVTLTFNRQSFAEYIGTARPSLSRELMNMETDGLIKVERDFIKILKSELLSDLK